MKNSRARRSGGTTGGRAERRHCPDCQGQRLNPIALNVRFRGRSIAELTSSPVSGLQTMIGKLGLRGREAEIARDVLAELGSRLRFLDDVGLGYLSLDRSAPTLSGGEAQRIRLAAQLGSNLQGVCYVLDEPTIGLHPRDNRVLLDTLDTLCANGNTLVVVEHDEDTIRHADHVIDLGPGAGTSGRACCRPRQCKRVDSHPAIGDGSLPRSTAGASVGSEALCVSLLIRRS